MFPGPKHRRDSDPRSAVLRERLGDSGIWHREIGRGCSGREDIRAEGEAESLLRADGHQDEAGLRRRRGRGRGNHRGQWPPPSLVLLLLIVVATGGLACRPPQDSAQLAFYRANQAFLHGDLTQSQHEAERGYQKYGSLSPQWAWKFRTLEAKSELARG